MTPLSAASARPTDRTRTTAAPAAPAGPVRLTDAEWAGRYDAIDLFAARLHHHACTGSSDPRSGLCSDTHWMTWTGPAIAVLAGAHVHIHHHTGGRRLVIELDLPDLHDDTDDTGARGPWVAA